MKSRKTLCSLLLLALIGGTVNPVNVLAVTEEIASEQTTTTEETTTTTTTEESTTITEEPLTSTTKVIPSSEATTVEEPTTTEEPATTEDPAATSDMVFEKGLPLTESATSIALGDNYPAYLKKIPYYSYTVDPWSYYHRQCTSFVAFRLMNTNKFTDVRMYGNASQWGTNAKKRGYTVNKTAAYGSVAWFSGGHVAWVSDIRGSNVEIEEYNVPANSGNYKKRIIPISSVTGFIHFKDLKPAKKIATQSVSLNKATYTLPAGTSFTLSATVKPSNASDKSVKWSTSNKKVATVSNGKVTAVAPGQATITVTTSSGKKTAKTKVTVQKPKPAPVYRLYNPNSKRHLYTKDMSEANILKARGWNFEGQKFITAGTGKPVYRLYNPHLKEHLYTTSKSENDILAARGWKAEGIAWYSAGTKPVYRLYHSKLNIHLYTTDKNEVSVLVKRGWNNEKVSFYTK